MATERNIFSLHRGNRGDGAGMDEAADWLARRDAGLSPVEEAEFKAWQASDPRHAEAISELTAAWTKITRPGATGRSASVLRGLRVRAQQRRRRHFAMGLAAACVALVAGNFVWTPVLPVPQPAAMEPSTVVVRPDRRTLQDGTVVDANAGTDLVVAFTAQRRSVTLVAGEAHFAVAKDPARPFVVTVGGVEVRAIGTEFAVRFRGEEVAVVVTEGEVAVARGVAGGETAAAAQVTAPVHVSAGGKVVVPAAEAALPRQETISPGEIEASLAWRGKRVELTGTRLAEVVALFNRQNDVQLTLGDPALANLRVSGIYWLDDPEGFARLMTASFEVRTEAAGDGGIALRSLP
jgi:transmembrane sensor